MVSMAAILLLDWEDMRRQEEQNFSNNLRNLYVL
jgi:hypothetical protein